MRKTSIDAKITIRFKESASDKDISDLLCGYKNEKTFPDVTRGHEDYKDLGGLYILSVPQGQEDAIAKGLMARYASLLEDAEPCPRRGVPDTGKSGPHGQGD